MRRTVKLAAMLLIAAAMTTTGAQAQSWYDHYDAGLRAVRKGDWNTVADRMTKAIALKPAENNRERAYGTVFFNYHPYYYRGIANYHLGRYQQAVDDLEKASGPGPENLGSVNELMQQARARLSDPDPAPTNTRRDDPQPPPPPPPPSIDEALRSQARQQVENAEARLRAAQGRGAANTQHYLDALKQWTAANAALARVRSNDDLQEVIAAARAAALLADAAPAPGPIPVPPPPPPDTRGPVEDILEESRRKVRAALEQYYRGDFDDAAAAFSSLTREMPRNGWIWAFLGASRYSQWAFDANDRHRAQANEAFAKARQFGQFRNGLPPQYFSRRIRRAFDNSRG